MNWIDKWWFWMGIERNCYGINFGVNGLTKIQWIISVLKKIQANALSVCTKMFNYGMTHQRIEFY